MAPLVSPAVDIRHSASTSSGYRCAKSCAMIPPIDAPISTTFAMDSVSNRWCMPSSRAEFVS